MTVAIAPIFMRSAARAMKPSLPDLGVSDDELAMMTAHNLRAELAW